MRPLPGRLPLRPFARDRRGVFLIAFAVALPLLLGSVSAAVEYGRLLYRRAQLQTAAMPGRSSAPTCSSSPIPTMPR